MSHPAVGAQSAKSPILKVHSREDKEMTRRKGEGREKAKSCFSRHHHCQHSHSVVSFLPAAKAAAAIVCSFRLSLSLSLSLSLELALPLSSDSECSVCICPPPPPPPSLHSPRPSVRPPATFLSSFTDELLLLLGPLHCTPHSISLP